MFFLCSTILPQQPETISLHLMQNYSAHDNLLLDIDGVLHPTSPMKGDEEVLCHLHRFESVMHDYLDWKMVISSSWREEISLETMQ